MVNTFHWIFVHDICGLYITVEIKNFSVRDLVADTVMFNHDCSIKTIY